MSEALPELDNKILNLNECSLERGGWDPGSDLRLMSVVWAQYQGKGAREDVWSQNVQNEGKPILMWGYK